MCLLDTQVLRISQLNLIVADSGYRSVKSSEVSNLTNEVTVKTIYFILVTNSSFQHVIKAMYVRSFKRIKSGLESICLVEVDS